MMSDAQAAARAAERPIDPNPDRATLEELMRSKPAFGALVEHFNSAYDDAIVKNDQAIKAGNPHYIGYTCGLIQAHLGSIKWLTRYAPKEK